MRRLLAMFVVLVALGACAGPGAGLPLEPGSRLKVAVIPFRNASNTPDAGAIVTHLMLHELMRSDIFEPVEPGLVREVMINQRVLAQEVSPELMQALLSELGVELVVLGVVEAHQDEKGPGNARSALAATLMGTRQEVLLWTGEGTLDGKNTGHVFRLGRLRTADQVARRVVQDLVRQMEEVTIARKEQIIDIKGSQAARR